MIARIDGVADRDAAEALEGLRLYVPRAALPPTGPEEYYRADLIGLTRAARRRHRRRPGRGGATISAPATCWRSSATDGAPVLAAVHAADRCRWSISPAAGSWSMPPAEVRAPADEDGLTMASARWTARVLTLFPEMFPGPLGHSLAGKALAGGRLGAWKRWTSAISRAINTAPSTTRPFGGGPGMVMRPDVVDRGDRARRSAEAATAVRSSTSARAAGC